MSIHNKRNVQFFILSGLPGIGKTTIVKKICELLRFQNVPIVGFYTEEVRRERNRIGFDLISLLGERGVLARVQNEPESSARRVLRVGQYIVDIKSFESIATPIFKQIEYNSVLVIDEIGKMELLSEKFQLDISNCLQKSNLMLATIPVASTRPIHIVESLRTHVNTKLFQVDRNNRDTLPEKIAADIVKNYHEGY